MSDIRARTEIGDYTIDRKLSTQGGCAGIYLAHKSDFEHLQVVLKVARTAEKGSGNGRYGNAYEDLLRLETNALCRLRHPGIVRIFPLVIRGRVQYAGRATNIDGHPWYFVMEHINHGAIQPNTFVEQGFPLVWRIELFYQLLTIVNYMHQMGYAHGDLKPDNIMLRFPQSVDQVPVPVLVDFGTVSDVDRVGPELAASPRYAPPELLAAMVNPNFDRDILVPEKIDVWALGAILFELVTGRSLIPEKVDQVMQITTLLRGQLDQISDLNPDAPPVLDSLLEHMLNRTPALRPPVNQLVIAVEEKLTALRPPRIGAISNGANSSGLFGRWR